MPQIQRAQKAAAAAGASSSPSTKEQHEQSIIRDKINNKKKAFTTICIVAIISNIVLSIEAPFYVDLFVTKGSTAATAFLFISLRSACAFVAAPLWGTLSDLVGRRLLIMVGFAGCMLTYLSFMSSSMGLILVIRVALGFMWTLASGINSYVCDVTDKDSRATALGRIGACSCVGYVIGVLVGGFVSTQYGTSASSVVAALFCLLGMVLSYKLPESIHNRTIMDASAAHQGGGSGSGSSTSQKTATATATATTAATAQAQKKASSILDSFGRIVRQQSSIPVLLAAQGFFVLGTIIFAVSLGEFNRINLHMSPQERGTFFMYYGIVSSIAQGVFWEAVILPLFKDESRSVAACSFVSALLLVLFPYTKDKNTLYILTTVLTIPFVCISPLMLGVISKKVAESDQGSLMGIQESLSAASSVVAPIVTSWYMPFWPFWLAALALFLGACAIVVGSDPRADPVPQTGGSGGGGSGTAAAAAAAASTSLPQKRRRAMNG